MVERLGDLAGIRPAFRLSAKLVLPVLAVYSRLGLVSRTLPLARPRRNEHDLRRGDRLRQQLRRNASDARAMTFRS